MKLALNIVVTFALAFWPLMLMMSPMMFDAPGSDNKRDLIITMMAILCYPVLIFAVYWVFGLQYFGLPTPKVFAVSLVIVLASLFLMGYFHLLVNSMRGISNSGYSVTKGAVYYDARPIEGANPESFEKITNDGFLADYYGKDSRQVYYREDVITGAKPENFRPLFDGSDSYWTDGESIFYDGKALPGAKLEGFERLDTGWSDYFAVSRNAEGKYVYFSGKLMKGVNPDTFTPLNAYLSKDENHIYYGDREILPEADAASFELIGDYLGKDKNAVYDVYSSDSQKIEGADPATFEALGRGYMKDKHRVYHRDLYDPTEALPTIDVESFIMTDWDEATLSDAKDKNHYYLNGKPVPQKAKK